MDNKILLTDEEIVAGLKAYKDNISDDSDRGHEYADIACSLLPRALEELQNLRKRVDIQEVVSGTAKLRAERTALLEVASAAEDLRCLLDDDYGMDKLELTRVRFALMEPLVQVALKEVGK